MYISYIIVWLKEYCFQNMQNIKKKETILFGTILDGRVGIKVFFLELPWMECCDKKIFFGFALGGRKVLRNTLFLGTALDGGKVVRKTFFFQHWL